MTTSPPGASRLSASLLLGALTWCAGASPLQASRPTVAWSVPHSVGELEWGDWDADGDLDLVTIDNTSLLILHNEAGSLVRGPAQAAVNANGLHLGDWDGDHDLDLVLRAPSSLLQLVRNVGTDVTFEPVETGTQPYSVAWGDWDGDGDLDLAVGGAAAAHDVVLVNDEGRFEIGWQSDETDGGPAVETLWGDWEGDGDQDLFIVGSASASVHENVGGDLELMQTVQHRGTSIRGAALHDWDDDGKLELFLSGDPHLSVWEIERSRTSLSWQVTDRGGWALSWADWDGDGRLDLLNDGTMWLSPGPRELVRAWHFPFGWTEAALGDFDGDGDPDLAGYSTPDLQLLLNPTREEMLDVVVPIMSRRPGNTNTAFGFSSAELLEPPVLVPYALRDAQSDTANIVVEYSTNGGGVWHSATPAPGGDGLTNLSSSPTGLPHVFAWDSDADRAVSDNAMIRVTVVQSGAAAISPPFRVRLRDGDDDGVPDLDDCRPEAGDTWSVPASVDDLRVMNASPSVLSWSVPAEPGGLAVRHDVLRSRGPADFTRAHCLVADAPGTLAQDAELPGLGPPFFYLVAAENDCGSGLASGSLGARLARACP